MGCNWSHADDVFRHEYRDIVCLDKNNCTHDQLVRAGKIGLWLGSPQLYRKISVKAYTINRTKKTIHVVVFDPRTFYEIEIVIPDAPGKYQVKTYDAVELRSVSS